MLGLGENMVSFEEACSIAVTAGMHYDYYLEYEGAFEFAWGPDSAYREGPRPLVILKETGEAFYPGFWDEQYWADKLLREGHIPKEFYSLLFCLRDAVYGAAVGDALGVPYEFNQRGAFECTGMVGNGSHHMPAGTFSDDTSMMLATCDSIRSRMRIDSRDMRKRFVNWWRSGAYTVDGVCFDIGNTTATALDEGEGRSGERDNGNGSLMRIAPLAYFLVDDDEIRAVSAITHAHPISTEACVCFVTILRNLISGNTFEDSIRYGKPRGEEFEFLDTVTSWSRDDVRSGGYVLDTLGAALWCFANTDNYADCVLTAVNLGRDTDTTACVAGALAGGYYGYSAIPAEWIETLRGKDIIESCLFEGFERVRDEA